MLLALPILAVLSTVPLSGDVTAAGGDYEVLPFTVPAGTVEIQIAHADGSSAVILDWGVWSPEGFRGWAGGLTDDAIIGVDESSRGYLEGPITPGEWQLVIGKAKLLQDMGHYDVVITCRDNTTLTPLPRAPWQPVTLSTGPRWYAGDFHVHSDESGDATASLDEIATYARGRGLDFVAISDHNTVSQIPRIGAIQPSVPDLLFMRAIEVTTYAGHGNAIGVDDYVDHRAGLDGVSATTILADVTAQQGMFIVNHPALELGDGCIGCAWNHPDTPWGQVAAIEVLTGPYELVLNLFTPGALALWDEKLDADYHIAAVGGGDDHRAGTDEPPAPDMIGSPTTMVYATELSEAAIMEGVRAGRTVVKLRGPADPMVEITVTDPNTDRTAAIGEVLHSVHEYVVNAHVVGGDGMELQLWIDGIQDVSVPVVGNDWRQDIPIAERIGTSRVRAELGISGARVVITSHIWVEGFMPGDVTDGCGCRGTDGTGGGPIVAALLLVIYSSRRSRARRAAVVARSSARLATSCSAIADPSARR